MLMVIGHDHEGIYLFIYRRMVVVREPERAGEGPVDITPKEYAVRFYYYKAIYVYVKCQSNLSLLCMCRCSSKHH